jgi:pimeloyl-ACP methyl ester carboxylesterase
MGAPHALAAALRHGPDLSGFVAPERIAGALLLNGSPRTVAALMTCGRIKRRMTSLVARRLGLARGIAPPAIFAFIEAYPRPVLLGAADVLGLAACLRSQGPVLLKADLKRLSDRLGRAVVEQALSLSLVLPGAPELDEQGDDGRAWRCAGTGMLWRWAQAHFGADASWIEAALPDLAPYPAIAAPDAMIAQALDWMAARQGQA